MQDADGNTHRTPPVRRTHTAGAPPACADRADPNRAPPRNYGEARPSLRVSVARASSAFTTAADSSLRYCPSIRRSR